MERTRAAFERAHREFNSPAPEPTIDELRGDFTRAIGDFANQNFSEQYGPLFGSVVESAAEKILLDLESNVEKAKHEGVFVIHELLDRIVRGISR